MSPITTRTADRPPPGGLLCLHSHWSRAAWLGRAVLLLVLLAAWAGGALAQSHPRTDPGTPPEPIGGSQDGWSVLTIPGLPAHAVLGDVWASADGHMYVWARYPMRGGPSLDEQGEGEKVPKPGEMGASWSSVLYRYDGASWTVSLRTPGESGVALLGSTCEHIYASTVGTQGEAQLYQFDGRTWRREILPGHPFGRMHTLAGVPGDLFFRVDRDILRHDGTQWTNTFELPVGEPPTRGLVYLAADCQFVMYADGHWLHHEGNWSEVPAGFAFAEVQDAWGMRDAQGVLQMYVVGSTSEQNGLRLWRFQETDPMTHAGEWAEVLSDPPGSGLPGVGSGLHLWGIAGNDVYATGVVDGVGHMFRFDGTAWNHLVPPLGLGTVHGVWGTPQGTVWFSVESGAVVRYQRGNQAPDLSAARPSVDRLWPPTLGMVRVDLRGIVDPEGDAVTVAIQNVAQDEDPLAGGASVTCPDAVVFDQHVNLRAEHAANGDGRTYEITFTATDRLGATSRGTVTVCAPHYATTPCTPDPALFSSRATCEEPRTERDPIETEELRGALRIRYDLEQPTTVHLGVYDVTGRLRGTVAEGPQAPGVHETFWDLSGISPGVYFVKLRGRGPALVRRVIVLH